MSVSELPVTRSDEFDKGPSQGYDLLRLRPVSALMHWVGFPYVFQAMLLAVFVAMAVLAWGLSPPEDVPGKLYAKTNLVTLLVWGLWWPAMVWVAVLLGRAWCAICPLELLANATERLGRRLGVRQRVLGKWLRSGALIVGLYALIQMSVQGVDLHRHPAYTSLFLWGLLAMAAFAGLFFKDRAFCRGFCPVGLLLGTYGRGGMLAMRPAAAEPCVACPDRECVRGGNRTRLDARSCPSLLNPARLNGNSDCLVCGQCVKACPPGNMGLFLRPLFPRGDAREFMASWPITLFVMLVSGFVVVQMFSEWPAAQELFLWVPKQVASGLGLTSFAGWIKGVWALIVAPAVLWSLLGGLVVLMRGASHLVEAWRRMAIPLAVLIAFAHMAKGLAKFVTWAGFLPIAAGDPSGVESGRMLAAKTLASPPDLLPMTAVSVTSIVLVLAGTYFALREFRLAQGTAHRSYQLPTLILASGLLFLVFGWGFLQ